MKKLVVAIGLMTLAGTALAAGKPCEELKGEIAAKLDAKVSAATRWRSSIKALPQTARSWVAAKAVPRKSSTSAADRY